MAFQFSEPLYQKNEESDESEQKKKLRGHTEGCCNFMSSYVKIPICDYSHIDMAVCNEESGQHDSSSKWKASATLITVGTPCAELLGC